MTTVSIQNYAKNSDASGIRELSATETDTVAGGGVVIGTAIALGVLKGVKLAAGLANLGGTIAQAVKGSCGKFRKRRGKC